MTVILTAAEMRALEQAAIDRGEVTGLELMERAGRGVVEAILAEWPEMAGGGHHVVVLCGPGNNGGDGFVVARLLKERGWGVEVFLYGDSTKLPPDARTNHDRWQTLGTVRPLSHPDATEDEAERFTGAAYGTSGTRLIIDALFGIGLVRPIPGLRPILEPRGLSASGDDPKPPKVVALDVPSGLSADAGTVLSADAQGPLPSDAVQADLTVTFHSLKPGHLLGDGPLRCGRVRVVDIGLPRADPGGPEDMDSAAKAWLTAVAPPGRNIAKSAGHKYTHGHALLLSGGCGRGGAARLAARGSLRVGAGLVTLAVPPAALQENAARLDAIMLRPIRDAGALAELLRDARLNALCAGPGLGTGEREAALLAALLDASQDATPGADDPRQPRGGRGVVLDADALTLLASHPTPRARLHARCVLTPHEGEFARLFPAVAERWRAPATTGPTYSKVDAARDAAREAGCVVLLKGPDTVIADPSGRAAINAAVYDRAAPWLATAGSGDVLAGFITGLLARGFAPFEAACAAAWLHVECARSFRPGLIAEDLAEELPKVFRALGL